jgi:hypothetical protein
MTRSAPVREQYVRRLARAIEWGLQLNGRHAQITEHHGRSDRRSGFAGSVPFSRLRDVDVPSRQATRTPSRTQTK